MWLTKPAVWRVTADYLSWVRPVATKHDKLAATDASRLYRSCWKPSGNNHKEVRWTTKIPRRQSASIETPSLCSVGEHVNITLNTLKLYQMISNTIIYRSLDDNCFKALFLKNCLRLSFLQCSYTHYNNFQNHVFYLIANKVISMSEVRCVLYTKLYKVSSQVSLQ